MRDLSHEHRADLAAAVERLASMAAREAVPDADQRQLWLATLTSLLAIRDSAEQLAASAALSAAEHGADYPEIGVAAGMTRQGARRKWPGLAGLAAAGQRKFAWWHAHGEQFLECVREVLDVAEESPWLVSLRAKLAETGEPADKLDLMLIDAHAVAMNDRGAARPLGLLAAFTADAYASTNGHSSLITRDSKACGTRDCPFESVVELLDAGPACRQHAVEALRRPATRIVAAYQPEAALSIFDEATR